MTEVCGNNNTAKNYVESMGIIQAKFQAYLAVFIT